MRRPPQSGRAGDKAKELASLLSWGLIPWNTPGDLLLG